MRKARTLRFGRLINPMTWLLALIGLGSQTVTTARADLALGAYLAGECVTCHRADGANKGIPPIAGWPEAAFVEVLQAYKTKARPNVVMQTISGQLTDKEMTALAQYFAAQKSP
jgi:cytochrome c